MAQIPLYPKVRIHEGAASPYGAHIARSQIPLGAELIKVSLCNIQPPSRGEASTLYEHRPTSFDVRVNSPSYRITSRQQSHPRIPSSSLLLASSVTTRRSELSPISVGLGTF